MANAAYIEETFPQLQQVSDPELKEGIIKCWLMAMEHGGWDSLKNIPFTLLIPETKKEFVTHTNLVTNQAIAIAKVRDDLDMDLVIASGLLHDVGKLLEYKRENGKVVKSEFGALVRHPVSGAGIAMNLHLPQKVVHVIAAHSKEGDAVTRIPEAILIHHCDFIDFHIEKTKY